MVSKLQQIEAVPDVENIRALHAAPDELHAFPALAIEVDDAYPVGEAVVITARMVNYGQGFTTVAAEITALAQPRSPAQHRRPMTRPSQRPG